MIITIKADSDTLRKINNLMQNCNNKQDMFDHLVHIGVNGFNALHMSNSFNPEKYSHSVLPLVARQQRKTYHCENGKVVLVEV